MNELSVTDLCGFVCEYLASTSVRIVWNKSRNQMGVHRYGCADECLDMASCRMLPDKGHSETADFQLLSPPTNKSTIHFWIAMVKWRMKRRRCIWIWIIYLFSFRMIYDLNSNFNHFCAFICQKMDVTYFVYECVRVILFQICWLKLDEILRMIRLHEMVRCIYFFFGHRKRALTVSNDKNTATTKIGEEEE